MSHARGNTKTLQKRLKRGHQQREAKYKGSGKEEEVSRGLPVFSLTLRPRKFKPFFFPIVV